MANRTGLKGEEQRGRVTSIARELVAANIGEAITLAGSRQEQDLPSSTMAWP